VMMFKAKVMHRVLKLRLNGFKQVLVVLDIRRERQLSDLGGTASDWFTRRRNILSTNCVEYSINCINYKVFLLRLWLI